MANREIACWFITIDLVYTKVTPILRESPGFHPLIYTVGQCFKEKQTNGLGCLSLCATGIKMVMLLRDMTKKSLLL